MRGSVVVLAAIGALGALGTRAQADDTDELAGASVIFARGSALYRVDARGKNEVELAQLPSSAGVRALRTDARGSVLLADLAGKWAWMPLDGSARTLTELPCADGPAQLAEDAGSVVCRSTAGANRSIIVELRGQRRTLTVDVPPGGARLVGAGGERALVWSDTTGVWEAPASDPKSRTRVSPVAPLRGFLASPDGSRGIGVFADQVYSGVRNTRAAEVLMTVQLDAGGARRKTIRDGVAVEWSHDSQWLLLQDGGSACIVRATGGQYKCWQGYTAASLSSDGHWGLVLGNRDGSKKQTASKADKDSKKAKKSKKDKKAAKGKKGKADPAEADTPDADGVVVAEMSAIRPATDLGEQIGPSDPRPDPRRDPRNDKPWDHFDEPSNEAEGPEPPPSDALPTVADDVNVAPPAGPLALYRVRLEGAFTDRPTLLVKVIDGAAVWVPASPGNP